MNFVVITQSFKAKNTQGSVNPLQNTLSLHKVLMLKTPFFVIDAIVMLSLHKVLMLKTPRIEAVMNVFSCHYTKF